MPPRHGAITPLLPGARFHDAWSVVLHDTPRTALELFMAATHNTPRWFAALMSLRNRLVQWVGLKNLGGIADIDRHKPASAYRAGDRVGIFTLISNSPDEVLLGDADKHLDVTLSVLKMPQAEGGKRRWVVTTVVHTHNALGRLYMLPVEPVHKVAMRAFLRRMEAAGSA